MNLSDITLNGTFDNASCASLTAINWGTGHTSIVNIDISSCAVDVVDLRGQPISGQLSIFNNGSTVLLMPTSTYTISQFNAVNNAYTTVNLGGINTDGLSNFFMQNSLPNQAQVDSVLIELDNNAVSGSASINVAGTNPAPSAAGITAKNSLISKGYTVTTN